ncbi:uncharacterized protein LOC129248347 [Anastrepha obliqua]|uniref:uncharacterized protein LOC129248347 n=1 Tax=Anastrepha obliqua TaxID=95512 RepID=UPI002409A657|nr:uncharacterized protein LOC129248347 [Anastrepha obliqua]
MAKQIILLVFSVSLFLQLTPSYTHDQAFNSFVKADHSPEQTEATKPSVESLTSEVAPLLIYTAILLEEHGRHIIRESRIFLKDVVGELLELPLRSEFILRNITRFNNLIQRIESIDLEGDSSAVLSEKSTLLDDIAQLLADVDLTAADDVANSEAVVYKKVFHKVDLKGFRTNLAKSAETTVHKFAIIFTRFWNSLGDTEKELLSELRDWWIHFNAEKNAEEKIKHFAEFLKIFGV